MTSDKFVKKIYFCNINDELGRELGHEKKKKNSCGWLKTCSYTCGEYYWEKDNRHHIKAFLLQANPRKAVKCLLQNITDVRFIIS